MCARASALRSSNSVRRRTTSRRNSMNCSMNSSRFSTRGRPPTIASMMMPKLVWSGVCLYRLLSTTSGISPRFSSMTMRMPSRSDSSRRSEMPSIVLSRTRSAIFSISRALLTWYGISDTTIEVLSPFFDCSSSCRARSSDGSASGAERVHDALAADDVAAGREVGTGHDPQQLPQALVTGRGPVAVVARVRRWQPCAMRRLTFCCSPMT